MSCDLRDLGPILLVLKCRVFRGLPARLFESYLVGPTKHQTRRLDSSDSRASGNSTNVRLKNSVRESERVRETERAERGRERERER